MDIYYYKIAFIVFILAGILWLISCYKSPKPKCSKGEARCRDFLENKFKAEFPASRPKFLKNSKTGKNLELDCYNKDLNIAVEYNGKQHYQFTPYFHKTPDDFVEQEERDNFKAQRCHELGIQYIVVPYWEKNVEAYLESKLS